MAQMEKCGALWIKEGKNGKFMSGIVGGQNILVFKNTRKEAGDKFPDYEVFKGQERDELRPSKDDSDIPF